MPDIRDRIVELRRVPAKQLNPHPLNWRSHPKAQQEALTEMLNKVGYADALLARELEDGTYELIDGHLRAEMTPDAEVPVLVLDVSEEEAKLLLTTLDPLTYMAETDRDNLSELLDSADIESKELLELLTNLLGKEEEVKPEIEPEDDEVPESSPPFSKIGYVWDIGPHRLVVGDSTDAGIFESLMQGEMADIVWTDPPYGVSYVGKTKEALTIDNDSKGLDDQEEFLSAAFTLANNWTKQGGVWYVAAPPGPAFLPFAKVLTNLEIWRQTITWKKDVMVMGHSDYHYQHEALLYGWRPGAAHHEPPDRKQTTIWEFDRPKASREHPTAKPVDLIVHSLLMSSTKDEIVLDMFGGSGSTMVAAHRAGRRARLIELDPHYADVILRRIQKVTGIKPVLAGTGQEYDFEQDFLEAQVEAMSDVEEPDSENEFSEFELELQE